MKPCLAVKVLVSAAGAHPERVHNTKRIIRIGNSCPEGGFQSLTKKSDLFSESPSTLFTGLDIRRRFLLYILLLGDIFFDFSVLKKFFILSFKTFPRVFFGNSFRKNPP